MGKNILELAIKYKVPIINGVSLDAGCPGVMNPLVEHPPIELTWNFLRGQQNKIDKVERYDQCVSALNALDEYTSTHNKEVLRQTFITLNIHGRAMFCHIALKRNNADELLTITAPHALEGLPMQAIPYGKGGVTVQAIFDQYIQPYIAPFIQDHGAAAAISPQDTESDAAIAALSLADDQSPLSQSASAAAAPAAKPYQIGVVADDDIDPAILDESALVAGMAASANAATEKATLQSAVEAIERSSDIDQSILDESALVAGMAASNKEMTEATSPLDIVAMTRAYTIAKMKALIANNADDLVNLNAQIPSLSPDELVVLTDMVREHYPDQAAHILGLDAAHNE